MQRKTVAALAMALCVLLAGPAIQRGEANFFLIGGACLVGLNAAVDAAGEQLNNLGLEGPLEVVREFCRLVEENSIPGIVLFRLVPALRDLTQFLAQGPPTTPERAAEFARLVTDLARQIVLNTNGRKK